MPGTKDPLPKGHPFTIDGTVRSLAPLTRLRAEIKNSRGKVAFSAEQTFSKADNVTEYRLNDPTYSPRIDCFSEKLLFQNLPAGTFTLNLFATDANNNTVELCSAKFKVTSKKWVRLLPNNLRDSYVTALRFFGSPKRFLFRYRFRSGTRLITVESKWQKKYLTRITGVHGKRWRCHVDAAPYFKKATRYIETSYVRVHGSDFDTGAVRLADLLTFNGSTVLRYISSLQFISHHSFGTAIDINAYSPTFRNQLSNREIIFRESGENLTYNGFTEAEGRMCYDFTYTGAAKGGPHQVPEPLWNYLLYELGFFRAGFSWGFYYPHACDGMHFTLTELSPSYFENGPYALRKIYEYLGNALAAPKITAQPEDASVLNNTTATFRASAEGDGLSYQWYYRKSPMSKWKKVKKDGTSASYTVGAGTGKNGYQYRCLVKNYTGSVYTKPASLYVKK